jgi:hypothetical protein
MPASYHYPAVAEQVVLILTLVMGCIDNLSSTQT